MSARGELYDVIVIGGGPAALSEVLHLASTTLRVLVVSEQFGGCMDILGDLMLQSYVPELEIAKASLQLVDFMRSKTESRPTGREYANYIRACFGVIPTDLLQGTVTSIQKHQGCFAIGVSSRTKSDVLHARQVILATGIRPKTHKAPLNGGLQLSCFDAYRRLANNNVEPFMAREICIIGSGNTAFQLAYSLARIAKRITLLANKYVGVYPVDSTDRFALRAPSLQTLELIEKTADRAPLVGPINAARGALAPIYLYVYDQLQLDRTTGCLQARIPTAKIGSPVVAKSLRAAVNGGQVKYSDNANCTWSIETAELTMISAIGVEANVIQTPWHDLIDVNSGFAKHKNGRTTIDGLYVSGCAAGYPSINLMQPVFGQVSCEGGKACLL